MREFRRRRRIAYHGRRSRLGATGIKLIAGNASRRLASGIAAHLRGSLSTASLKSFADHETSVVIEENVRGEDVFVVQSTSTPTNDNLMELLIIIDALVRASARRITAVLPYFGYARQDRKVGGRTPITAKLVANLLQTSGADRVLTMDLHAGQIQGFFDIPTDNLFAAPVMERDIRARYPDLDKVMIISPDIGGVVRARLLAERLKVNIAIVDKFRAQVGQSQVMNVIGEVAGAHCILLDDIIDSGGTMCNAAVALREKGAVSVAAYASHGVLSGGALPRITSSELTELVITDSIEQPAAVLACPKIRQVSIAPLMGEAIRRIANEESISELFK